MEEAKFNRSIEQEAESAVPAQPRTPTTKAVNEQRGWTLLRRENAAQHLTHGPSAPAFRSSRCHCLLFFSSCLYTRTLLLFVAASNLHGKSKQQRLGHQQS